MSKRYKSILSIAGSDSGGGAGIQADIKSISANGGYAATVITATTAQNTQGVMDIHGIPPEHIEKQLEAVLSDIEFGAVKIGMLHSVEVIEVVNKTLKRYDVKNIIVDPVMVATSGDRLLSQEAIESLRAFLPSVLLVTPNVPEAEILLGKAISLENIESSAKELSDKFQTSVLLKGGHLELQDEMTDVLFVREEQKTVTINNKAMETKHTHGTGCSLSSAIATFVSFGFSLEESVIKGCSYVNKAIEEGKDMVLGKGNNPINHFGL